MESLAFTIFDQPVSYGQAMLGGLALLLSLLVVLVIVTLRGRSRQIAEASDAAAQNVRISLTQQIADRDGRISELQARDDRLSRSNTDLEARAAGLQVKLDEQSRSAAENLERFQNARQQMTDEFKLVAGDILKSHSENFTKLNREQVDGLLKPLNEKITEFHTGMIRDRAAMSEQIQLLARSNLEITTEAQNLTRALKGNSQSQGAWGEMILSTILERSGLREGEQYFTQQNHGADDGGRVRTDVEIVMPNGDRMVIDSKVSLTAFEAFTNEEDEDSRQKHLSAHVRSLRGHVSTLSSKDYQRHARSGLDFVLMFVPIESAYSVAWTHDPSILDYAHSNGVIIATPTTLMSALRTIRNVWDIEKRHQNAEEIAERAGALYDKVQGFLGSMDKLDTHLNRARQSYDEAKGQLSTGRGNVVRQVEMLRDLGAKSSKQLPAGWNGGDESAQDDPVGDESNDEAAANQLRLIED